MKRIFIAVRVEAGAGLISMISSLKARLANENIRWIDTANIHLTLAFLGDTEEERIISLTGMLKEKCSGFGDFEFGLGGAGLFKNYRDARVIWAGITGSERLSELNEAIAGGLKENGFPVEVRPFRPHLTIGRLKFLKDPENLRDALEGYGNTEFQTVNVTGVILYESILMRTGSVYRELGKFPLS
ncbi:MAG: RNA 2',3'-cyclic phosphodiesterase [Bacteroidales bacterium]